MPVPQLPDRPVATAAKPESSNMAQLTLYHAAPSRSSIVHWMLEEVGEPYDIHLVSFKKGENRRPDYLAVNPMLNVPVGNPKRGVYLKWLFFGPSCVEPAIWERAYPRKEAAPRAALGFGEFETVIDVLAKAAAAARPYL